MSQLPQAFFDNYALDYDAHFSHSSVGKAQRQIVYSYLQQLDPTEKSVLEINCGTGIDAVFLSERYRRVICTDISAEMIEVTRARTVRLGNCSVIQSSIQTLNIGLTDKSDLLFSNFGGLNCLNEDDLRIFSRDCLSLLNKESELILVIMGKKCLWERIYFIGKGNFKTAFRRKRHGGTVINRGEEAFGVFYYSPGEVAQMFTHFEVSAIKPVGLFVPPSYLNSFFERHTLLFSILKRLDKALSRFSFLADYADHYLIHFKAR